MMFIHVFPFPMECDIQMIMEIWIYRALAGYRLGSASYRFLILEDEIPDRPRIGFEKVGYFIQNSKLNIS